MTGASSRWLCTAALLLAACGGGGPGADSGAPDSGTPDAGPTLIPENDPHLPFRLISNQGGPVLTHPAIVTVTHASDPTAGRHEAFDRAMIASRWFASWRGEYGISDATVVQDVRLDFDPPNPLVPSDLHDFLLRQILDGGIPGPDAGVNLYLYYPPPGVELDVAPGVNVCGTFAGETQGAFHWETWYDTLHIAYAAIPTCALQDGGVERDELIDFAATHEFAEAVTDPRASTDPAWLELDDAGLPWSQLTEIADRCGAMAALEGGHRFSRVWSNAAASDGGAPCVPAPEGVPIGVTTLADGPITVDAGAPYSLQLQAWATDRTDPWTVDVEVLFGGFRPTATPIAVDGGATVTLELQIPSGAAGESTLLFVHSRRGSDDVSAWPVWLIAQ